MKYIHMYVICSLAGRPTEEKKLQIRSEKSTQKIRQTSKIVVEKFRLLYIYIESCLF